MSPLGLSSRYIQKIAGILDLPATSDYRLQLASRWQEINASENNNYIYTIAAGSGQFLLFLNELHRHELLKLMRVNAGVLKSHFELAKNEIAHAIFFYCAARLFTKEGAVAGNQQNVFAIREDQLYYCSIIFGIMTGSIPTFEFDNNQKLQHSNVLEIDYYENPDRANLAESVVNQLRQKFEVIAAKAFRPAVLAETAETDEELRKLLGYINHRRQAGALLGVGAAVRIADGSAFALARASLERISKLLDIPVVVRSVCDAENVFEFDRDELESTIDDFLRALSQKQATTAR